VRIAEVPSGSSLEVDCSSENGMFRLTGITILTTKEEPSILSLSGSKYDSSAEFDPAV
jgi:hypothetical protein